MSRHTHYLTLEFRRSTLEVAVDFDYQPGEPMVMYFRDGGGDPGCPSSAELIEVCVYDWLVGDESRERSDSAVWESLDTLAESVLQDKWSGHFEDECLESITELEPDDCY